MTADPSTNGAETPIYKLYKDLLIETSKHQFEYGKWLLASLLAVHGGSLLAISQAGEAKQRLYQACGPYLIWGIAAALVAGGLAWINFSAVHSLYFRAVHDLAAGRQVNWVSTASRSRPQHFG